MRASLPVDFFRTIIPTTLQQMPTHAKSHEECRPCICLLCFSKTKVMRNISDSAREVIDKHILSIDFNDHRYPTALCSNCYTIICEYKKNNFARKINLFDHSKLTSVRPLTRTTDKCVCLLCDTARASSTANFGLSNSVIKRKKPGRTPLDPSTAASPESVTLCTHCLSELARGKAHNCTQTQRHNNLITYAQGSSCSSTNPGSEERIATSIIRSKMCEDDCIDGEVLLSAKRGRPLFIQISNDNRSSDKRVTVEDIHNIKTDLNLSTNQTKTLTKHIRSALGTRKATEPYIRENLLLKSHQLDALFCCENRDFDCSSGKSFTSASNSPIVFCTALNELRDRVVLCRQFLQNDFDCIIGVDSGGGFLKVCLTIRSASANTNAGNGDTTGRSTLSEGVAAKSLRDTSVKKLFIIAIVPDAQETYRNMLILWNLLKLTSPQEHSPYTFCMDLKLANIMLGLMSHACLHPCTWCDAEKDELSAEGNLRSLGKIRDQYWSFVESEKKASKAKEYGNCIHAPLFKFSDATLVMDILPPPELHLLLGVVNFLYFNLEKIWPDAIQWPKCLQLEKEAFHGGSFAGNACRKLLRNVDKLANIVPHEHNNFVSAFRAFNDVVSCCFGKSLERDYKQKIRTFQTSFLRLGLRVTPKIHCVFFHVIEFCDSKECGLGVWSEQAFESVHADFAKHWERYKVPSSHEKFGDRLLRAVQEYNSNHI